MSVTIGNKAPNLKISNWFQGNATNIDQEIGNVILVEVFQVNCPGCFIYGIPEAINIYNKFKDKGVRVLGLATAFEDYDKNTADNLKLLLESGETIGETRNVLGQYGHLVEGNKLPYKIPFPVAMDSLKPTSEDLSDGRIMEFIETNIPNFKSYNEKEKEIMIAKVRHYLQSKKYSAETFEQYALRGTPSTILIDREGKLRNTTFGANGYLQGMVEELLKE